MPHPQNPIPMLFSQDPPPTIFFGNPEREKISRAIRKAVAFLEGGDLARAMAGDPKLADKAFDVSLALREAHIII